MNARIEPSLDLGPEPSPTSPAPPTRAEAAPRSAYRRFVPLTTRWMDNDVYGHLNNVVYYSLFDSAVNGVLIDSGALDIERGEVIGLVVETQCSYFSPLAFPQPVEAGLRVARLGGSSITSDVGVFAAGGAETAARGRFVHVYVDRASRRPVPLPARLQAVARELQ